MLVGAFIRASFDLERTRELSEDIIRKARAAHDRFPEGIALAFLVDIALDQGRVEDAVSPAESSYRIFRDLGDLLEPDQRSASGERISVPPHAAERA